MTTDFYSCTADDPIALVNSGAVELSVSYRYDVITTSSSSSDSALDEDALLATIQSSMLRSVARRAGLEGCGGGIPMGDGDPWRRRRGLLGGGGGTETTTRMRMLRGGRGSNSIVGLSSVLVGDVAIVEDETCDDYYYEGDAAMEDIIATAMALRAEDPFDNAEDAEIVPGMAGAVVVMDDEEEEEDEEE
eukprot:CAMPEP_0181082186 /NCGR_PEP_ID=MMETSP1071-20121207/3489_1 /TAXON_ID=35127 /ORGANISM="Thalassiosira sp., Strain NH16" /LENGTH=189 /DNA_ID=CAMNT_0023163759 /DNA_START=212 /DNA_END=778 /DNA_ORIENTATION=+